MQFGEASLLAEEWREAGNKTCPHTEIEKETGEFGSTGDYCCTTCGYCWWGRPKPQEVATQGWPPNEDGK